MFKPDFVEHLNYELGISRELAGDVLDEVFRVIRRSLVKDGRFFYRGFGTISVRKWKPRKARNPIDGSLIHIPAKKVVRFKPVKDFDEELNKGRK